MRMVGWEEERCLCATSLVLKDGGGRHTIFALHPFPPNTRQTVSARGGSTGPSRRARAGGERPGYRRWPVGQARVRWNLVDCRVKREGGSQREGACPGLREHKVCGWRVAYQARPRALQHRERERVMLACGWPWVGMTARRDEA